MAVRDVRRGRMPAQEVRGWISALVETQVKRDPGAQGVERLLPGDWFDRAWVSAERTWPNGRRRRNVPRWMMSALAGAALGLTGAAVTYLVITAEATTEVISELIAEPIDDPDALVVPGPIVEPVPDEVPELFGDVELGELPTYDLTGEGGRRRPAEPTIGPQERGDAGAAGGDEDTTGGHVTDSMEGQDEPLD